MPPPPPAGLVGSSWERWVRYHRIMARATLLVLAAHAAAAVRGFGWAVTSPAATCHGEGRAGLGSGMMGLEPQQPMIDGARAAAAHD